MLDLKVDPESITADHGSLFCRHREAVGLLLERCHLGRLRKASETL